MCTGIILNSNHTNHIIMKNSTVRQLKERPPYKKSYLNKTIALILLIVCRGETVEFSKNASQPSDQIESGITSTLEANDTDATVDDKAREIPVTSNPKQTMQDNQGSWKNASGTSGYFEGDTILSSEETFRNYNPDVKIWPNAELPYEIADNFSPQDRELILWCLSYIEKTTTCIKPIPANSNHGRSVLFVNEQRKGCGSSIGSVGGQQKIYLESSGCMYADVILHELLHTLGFAHQHSAHNRDDYVTIHEENIRPGFERDFEKVTNGDDLGFPYDFASMTHYHANAYSRNSRLTIVAKRPVEIEYGKLGHFSDIDIKKIRKLYGCDSEPIPPRPTTTTTEKSSWDGWFGQ